MRCRVAPRVEPPTRAKLAQARRPFVSATLFSEEAVEASAAERSATWLSLASRWNGVGTALKRVRFSTRVTPGDPGPVVKREIRPTPDLYYILGGCTK